MFRSWMMVMAMVVSLVLSSGCAVKSRIDASVQGQVQLHCLLPPQRVDARLSWETLAMK